MYTYYVLSDNGMNNGSIIGSVTADTYEAALQIAQSKYGTCIKLKLKGD